MDYDKLEEIAEQVSENLGDLSYFLAHLVEICQTSLEYGDPPWELAAGGQIATERELSEDACDKLHDASNAFFKLDDQLRK